MSTSNVNNSLVVGGSGVGTLTINAATVTVRGQTFVGDQAGSNGLLTIGAGGVLQSPGPHIVAASTVIIGNNAAAGGLGAAIGNATTAVGALLVSDAGSVSTPNGDFADGRIGSGTATIQNAGTLQIVGNLILGGTLTAASGTGALSVVENDGGSNKGLDRQEIGVDHAALRQGWWPVERAGGGMARWTDGAARLDLPEACRAIEIELAADMQYPVAPPTIARPQDRAA